MTHRHWLAAGCLVKEEPGHHGEGRLQAERLLADSVQQLGPE